MGLLQSYLCLDTFTQVPRLLPQTPRLGDNAGGVLQTVSLLLCSPCTSDCFSALSKEKALHPFSNRSGPHYAQEIPAGTKGEDQRETAAGKVKTQAGRGWEVCRALIPCTKGLILTRQAVCRTPRVDSPVLLWQALQLCSAFRILSFQALLSKNDCAVKTGPILDNASI